MIISKGKEYHLDGYSYKNFIMLTREECEMVLRWRNNERIRQWMNHTELIPLENHLRYVESLKHRDDVYYWLVFKDGMPTGVVDILNYDSKMNCAETGYYLNPDFLDAGYGFEFYYYFKLFFHDALLIDRTVGELRVGNVNSYMLITYFGGLAENLITRDDALFLTMVTLKDNFDAIKDGANDVVKFAKYVKKNKVDWNQIINQLKQ